VQHNLEELDAPFTHEEIAAVIKEMPPEKSPGPDGYIGIFYKKCWPIIKEDLTQAIFSFYLHRTTKLNLVNEANIVLLTKNQVAATISDYRPISLINSVAKIITKILANRLALKMNELVSGAHNAFIKKDAFTTISYTRRELYNCSIGRRNRPYSSNWIFLKHSILLVGISYLKSCKRWGLARNGVTG
jgi:hypothetical protein